MSGIKGRPANPRLHHDDGTHRESARSSDGAEVGYFDSHIREHLAEHQAEDAAATPAMGPVTLHGVSWQFCEVEPNDDGRYGAEVRHTTRPERYGYVTQEEDGTFGAMGLREDEGFVPGFASREWAGRFLVTHRRPQPIDD